MMAGAVAASDAAGRLRGGVTVVAKMNPGATDREISGIKQFLNREPWVAQSMFTSADDVLAQELEYNAEIKDLIDENPFSAEFEIRVKPDYIYTDSLLHIRRTMEGLEAIDHVVLPVEMAEGITTMVSKVQIVLGIVAGILLLISIVLIFNTVSLSVYSRRLLIHTMKLVGATPGFIRGPFIRSGMISGAIAGAIAAGLIWLMAGWAQTRAADWGIEGVDFAQYHIYLACISGILIVCGTLICGIASLFATNKYIGASYDDYFK